MFKRKEVLFDLSFIFLPKILAKKSQENLFKSFKNHFKIDEKPS